MIESIWRFDCLVRQSQHDIYLSRLNVYRLNRQTTKRQFNMNDTHIDRNKRLRDRDRDGEREHFKRII